MESSDYIDIQPWPATELVGHLVASAAVARRGMMEFDESGDPFELETDRFELESWARLELTAWLDDADFAILECPVGNLSFEQEQSCDERLVVASTIAWAIRAGGVESLPVQSDGAVENTALSWAPGPWTQVRQVVKSARTRSDEELAGERERWEIILWRCELFEDPAMADEDRRALREAIVEIEEENLLKTVDGDIALDDDRPFSALFGDDIDQVGAVAETRLRTLNWVCGFGERPLSAPLYLEGDDA